MKKKLLSLLLACTLLGTAACSGGKTENTTSGNTNNQTTPSGSDESKPDDGKPDDGKPDTWIADRTISIQAYVGDIGDAIPDDINNVPVMQELTRRTGIKLEILYTPGEKDRFVMAAQMAAGTIPDVIVSYMNDSSRPEFPILLKAAKEGMFADVSPYFADSKVYSNYLKDDYLPNDTKKNIMFRDDLDGAVYLVHLRIPRVDKSLIFDPDEDFIGGMYIQKSIADTLGIDPREIITQDQLYDLLVQIKEGGFTDNNGNPVYPLGPKFWGGSVDALEHDLRELHWGISDGYNMMPDGEIYHEAETEYAFKKIEYFRKLIEEGLVNPEYFTMDSTRAEEVSRNKNSAIIGDVHNYMDIIYETEDWLPIGPINYYTGDNRLIEKGKSGYGAWAISAKAENPDEIFAFFDYLSTYEGMLLTQYGIEGEHYTMEDGYPRVTEQVETWLKNSDRTALINNVGAGYDGEGLTFFSYMRTNRDDKEDFGEARPGAGSSDTYSGALKVAEYSPREYQLVEGLSATAYLSAEGMEDIQAQMNLLDYKETLVQAIFAPTWNDAEQIIFSFREQLKSAGVDEFKAYLKEIYDEDNKAIGFYY